MSLTRLFSTPIYRWRARIFVLTWMTYAAYYLTRKNYPVALPEMMKEFGWEKSDVGIVVTAYLVTYAAGQFINGMAGDKLGARVMIAVGFGLTAMMSLGLGVSTTIAMMAVMYGINGWAQSTGWPSVNKIMAAWFPPHVRGRAMGWWGTNYAVGSAVASAFAAFILDHLGWRAAFWIPAAVSIGVGSFILLMVRNGLQDEDTGIQPVPEAEQADVAPVEAPAGLAATIALVSDWRIMVLGASYFGIKFVRYTIDFWLPLFFVEQLALGTAAAGYLMVFFPRGGSAGPIAGGWLSDWVFGARRGPPSVVMLIGLCLSLVMLRAVGADLLLLAVALCGIGFFLYGPDMLLSGTAAQDFGSREGAATVSGFVNGCGSIGAAVQGLAVPLIAQSWGWNAVFGTLVVMAAVCALIASLLWNATARG